MKHYFLLLIIFLGSVFWTFGQESEKQKKISPEITISLNQTTVGFRYDKAGFGIGAYNAFFNQKRCNLVVGLEFNWNCQLRKYTNSKYESESMATKNYLGVPVYFRVNLGKKVKFFFEQGLFFDPFVFGREKYTEKSVETGIKSVINNKMKLYKSDFGISGGIGIRIPVKAYELLLKCDYKYGLRKIIDFSSKSSVQNPMISLYNQYIRFTIGFKVNFISKIEKM